MEASWEEAEWVWRVRVERVWAVCWRRRERALRRVEREVVILERQERSEVVWKFWVVWRMSCEGGRGVSFMWEQKGVGDCGGLGGGLTVTGSSSKRTIVLVVWVV